MLVGRRLLGRTDGWTDANGANGARWSLEATETPRPAVSLMLQREHRSCSALTALAAAEGL